MSGPNGYHNQQVQPGDNPFVVISKTLPAEITAAFLLLKQTLDDQSFLVPASLLIGFIIVPLYSWKALGVRRLLQIVLTCLIFFVWATYIAESEYEMFIRTTFGVEDFALPNYTKVAAVILGLLIPLIMYNPPSLPAADGSPRADS